MLLFLPPRKGHRDFPLLEPGGPNPQHAIERSSLISSTSVSPPTGPSHGFLIVRQAPELRPSQYVQGDSRNPAEKPVWSPYCSAHSWRNPANGRVRVLGARLLV